MESHSHTSVADPPPPPPVVARKFGSYYKQWSHNGYGSLGSRSIGKVLIDCKLRFSDSQWGVLGLRGVPAGILYVDLTFSQPDKYRLSSASIRITLEEHKDEPKTSSARDSVFADDSQLAVTDHFGPKLLTGKTTTREGRLLYSAIPEFGACGFSAGGLGVQAEKTVHCENRWVLSGHHVAGSLRDGSFDATYKTLVWDLSENELDAQPLHSNTFHTGLALTHDAKPFFIKVEIEGRLRKRLDRLRYRFPARGTNNQGTATTLIRLGSEYRSGTRLDALARGLDRKMVLRNLHAAARQIPDAVPLSVPMPGHEEMSVAGGDLAVDAGSERCSESSSQLTMVDQLSAAVSVFSEAPSKSTATESEMGNSDKNEEAEQEEAGKAKGPERSEEKEDAEASNPLLSELRREMELQNEADLSATELQEILRQETETAEERLRRLSGYPSVLLLLHLFSLFLDFISPRKAKKD